MKVIRTSDSGLSLKTIYLLQGQLNFVIYKQPHMKQILKFLAPRWVYNCIFKINESNFWFYNRVDFMTKLLLTSGQHHPFTIRKKIFKDVVEPLVDWQKRVQNPNNTKFLSPFTNHSGRRREGVSKTDQRQQPWLEKHLLLRFLSQSFSKSWVNSSVLIEDFDFES